MNNQLIVMHASEGLALVNCKLVEPLEKKIYVKKGFT